TREAMPALAAEHRVSEVIIAMPTAPGASIREILDVCRHAGVAARTIPGLYDILSGQATVSQIRDVDIEDLLRREPVQIDAAAVRDLLHGKRILVTGGGGSIGGELCRQALRAAPEHLVLLGHGENSIFEIHSQLEDMAEETMGCAQAPPLSPVIADVRDRERLQQVFDRYRPELVFHAAAHKHVPLMEANVCEAIANNVLGTRNLISVSEQSGVDHFILISTDKAVNPTSVMGVTKRIAELLVYQAARRNHGCFSAVRFGNVLGSRGSVLHTFRRQIAAGKPVTVTHPEMKRYFMTIPEAVMLVLQAAALGKGGEVFVLDMGEPVCMVDLATDLIKLSGLKPRVQGRDGGEGNDWDIEVVFTGVRPGEKLFEELFVDGEGYGRTRHEKIFVAMNGGDCDDGRPREELDAMVDRLIGLAQAGDRAGVVRTLKEIVPQYEPAGRG
ncbi:MAG: NAD-dependent epimerase/dehydratase family protein, partial [Ardenticatenales bacterium]|nr:NAD-dependent epimerase/dehydratase family protein [Ardenticatenales bacterium]